MEPLILPFEPQPWVHDPDPSFPLPGSTTDFHPGIMEHDDVLEDGPAPFLPRTGTFQEQFFVTRFRLRAADQEGP
jgi:hypothetical protein